MKRSAVALVAAVVLAAGCSGDDVGGGPDADPTSTTVPADDVTVVSSTADADPADLAELVAISPLVVTGRVAAVERGEPVPAADGEADADSETGVESALVTVEVDRVLVGADPGPTVEVEEEGWMDDTRISVDGAPPTEVGDEGIWFLVHTGTPADAPWLTVGRVGRWVVREGVLVGPRLDIGLAIDLQDRPLADVVAEVEGLTGGGPG